MNRRPTVLVVEDELLIRWALGERLAEAGFDVREAENGAAARASFGPEVAVAVLDLRLPDVNGIELLRAFKKENPSCRLVLMSAYATVMDQSEALRAGASAVVAKPFEVDDMVARIRTLVAA